MRMYRFLMSYEGKRCTLEAYGDYKGQALHDVYEYLSSYKGYIWENITCVCGIWIKDKLEIKYSQPINKSK